MAYKSVKELMTAIADKIRFYLETDHKIKSTEIPEKIDAVKNTHFEYGYNHGLVVGDTEGYDRGLTEGIEQGKKAQYDKFWDKYQLGGTRKTLDFFFAGKGWTTDTLIPKYDLRPSRANSMFSLCDFDGDLAQHFENLGRALDFSNCTMAQSIFSNASSITRLGLIDFRKVTYGSSWFINMFKLITIDKLLISENTVAPGAAFDDCTKLINIAIEGVINKNGYNFKWSTKLSKASWISIVNAYSATISNLSMTGSLVSVNKAFETSEGANDGSTSEEWLNLIASKPNVTFNLI